MRVFTAHEPPPGRARPTRLVPEGFALGGLLLGPAWLLLQGAWPFALLAALSLAVLPGVAWPGVFLLSGLCGHDARRAMLAWRGWRLAGVVMGASHDQAELRWFDRQAVSAADSVR